MGWLAGKAVYEEREIEEDVEKCVRIRVYVEDNVWRIFKGAAQINGIDVKEALTDAMKLYLAEINSGKSGSVKSIGKRR